ncbi:class C sortase [Helcococcus ovis]|uniref:Class C sortase n=1 Tax=Helcococcus ovis TaxID=72026 RepID=A0A4R9C3G5_9FIRM|nr:class C sortase [Helcococcus ovis]TFF65437.1 class C sortase [Helcococcus ovis]TFF66073.1 class C sortase [Helcococcus ovis]TFF67837.1 class C sortase [Helcococcus ovis]WNZ02016.1 class C sortase [Helcococcus ovis]
MKNRKKTMLFDIVLVVISLISIGYLLYPIYQSRVIEKRNSIKTIQNYLESKNGNINTSSININDVDPIDEVVGVIYIPRVSINLPIFLGVSDQSLSQGAGLMKEFGLLEVKKGVNSVITSHNGESASGLFSNLEYMKIGDDYYIQTKKGIQKYIVKKIFTVLPSDINVLKPDKDKIQTTLLTCVPFGINSHRLLVKGEFVELVNEFPEMKFVLSNYEKKAVVLISGYIILALSIKIIMKKRGKNE